MRKTRKYTETEKMQILEDVKNVNNVVVVAKKYNIPTTTPNLEFLVVFYNTYRLHGSLGYRAPMEVINNIKIIRIQM